MEIVKLQTSKLSLDPSNSRKHEAKNLDAIKASLKRFKQQKPIVIDKNNVIIAGNGTFQAAIEIGWTEIDCVYSDLKGSDRTAYSICDNRLSDISSWEDEVLGKQLQALREDGLDLSEIGFDITDMAMFEIPESALGKEFDESCADGVEFITCEKCGHSWPK